MKTLTKQQQLIKEKILGLAITHNISDYDLIVSCGWVIQKTKGAKK